MSELEQKLMRVYHDFELGLLTEQEAKNEVWFYTVLALASRIP